ncbi:hypothetical protein [Mycobacterium uberis]|nr:hypothetical protein [Mycobacterium uberis]
MATDPESMLFPHLYGWFSVRAAIRMTSYLLGPNGTVLSVTGFQDSK